MIKRGKELLFHWYKRVSARIQQWRTNLKGKYKKVPLIVIGFLTVFIIVVAGFHLYTKVKVYKSYIVTSEKEREDTSSSKYRMFKGKLLKYSADGVAYLDDQYGEIWNQTFNFPTPIVDMARDSVAISSERGNEIYIFDEKGKIGEVKTELPILKIRVANQGVVVAILDNGAESEIKFYDSQGSVISEFKLNISRTGYPLDLDISPDGMKIVVSYLGIKGDSIKTSIAVYNFGTVGQNYENNMVSSVTYEGEVAPQVYFHGNDTVSVVRDNGFSIFSGKQIMKESVNVSFDGREAQSTFMDRSHIGFLFKSQEEEKKYEMRVYDLKGKLLFSKNISDDYQTVSMENGRIILLDDMECSIYNLKGTKNFFTDFSSSIEEILSADGKNQFTIIQKEKIQKIRLK